MYAKSGLEHMPHPVGFPEGAGFQINNQQIRILHIKSVELDITQQITSPAHVAGYDGICSNSWNWPTLAIGPAGSCGRRYATSELLGHSSIGSGNEGNYNLYFLLKSSKLLLFKKDNISEIFSLTIRCLIKISSFTFFDAPFVTVS